MTQRPPIMHVISLGAGVQSTTMALMAAHGEIEPMPDAAIFADTGAEPQAVYEHLDWLRSPGVLPFPVEVVRFSDLADDIRKTAAGVKPVAALQRQPQTVGVHCLLVDQVIVALDLDLRNRRLALEHERRPAALDQRPVGHQRSARAQPRQHGLHSALPSRSAPPIG